MLLDISPNHMQIVRGILRHHVPDREVWAFGSRAKWTARDNSDLDLCISGDTALGFKLLAQIKDDFSESNLPWKVDVVDWATTSASFRKIIEEDKVVVQTGQEGGVGSDWKEINFGDFIALQRGHDLPDQDRRPGNVPILGSFGITGFHDTVKAKRPGVTIGRSGASFGVAAYTDEDYWPLNTALYVTDFKGNHPKYVYYFLSLFDFSAYNSGSAQPSLNRNNLYGIPIRVPYPFIQENIANFLTILDDRITLLRETNATLEAIAQALFKSWFVDFDPVHAKQQGLVPEGMDEATAALFPDSFEESELGLVPKGWRVGTLADLATLNPESWTAKKHPDTVAYIDLANAKDNVISAVADYPFDEAPSRARRVLRDGDTIVGTVRPGNRSFAFIHKPSDNLTASTGFAVLRPTRKAHTGFVFLAATQGSSIEHLAHIADGGAYPAVRPEVVAGIQCVLPDGVVMQAFHDVTTPILASVSEKHQQAQTLANLRDTLLPRLISGQLRLSEADAS